MDVKAFFQKVREIEAELPDEWVVIVSLSTPDGGRAGIRNEVSRSMAARLVAGSKARQATAEEAQEHRGAMAAERAKAEEIATSHRIQVALVSDIQHGLAKVTKTPVK